MAKIDHCVKQSQQGSRSISSVVVDLGVLSSKFKLFSGIGDPLSLHYKSACNDHYFSTRIKLFLPSK